MKAYVGTRNPQGCTVTALDDTHPDESYLLNPRYDLRNHSPDGYEWSFAGSGPSQTSLALLADALGDDERALANYMRFKFKVVGRLPREGWQMTQAEVL